MGEELLRSGPLHLLRGSSFLLSNWRVRRPEVVFSTYCSDFEKYELQYY